MADPDGQIIIGIELDDGTIKKVKSSADGLAKAIGGDFSGIVSKGVDKSFTGIITQLRFVADVGKAAFGAISRNVSRSVDEANLAEQALTKFNAVLANSGKFSQEASDDFRAFAESLQAVGTVGDDAVISAASALVSIGGLTGQALKDATQSAVDFSAGLGVDLSTSFDLVAKAASGNISALSRYGIRVDESIPKSERFAEALRQINERFGGLDAARANTFQGAVTGLNNAISDTFQAFGEFITKSPEITAVIRKITELIGSAAKQLTAFGGQNIVGGLVADLLRLGTTITGFVLPPLELLFNAGSVVFNQLRTGLQTIIVLVAKVAEGFGFLGNALGLVSNDFLTTLTAFSESSQEVLASFAEQTNQSAEDIFNFNVSDAIVNLADEIATAAEDAGPLLQPVKNNITTTVNEITATISEFAKKAGDIIKSQAVRGISQGIQSIVGALATGGNAFKAFTKSVLNIIGDLLIQLGEAAIGIGIGIDAIRASVVGLAGGQAIAAGIALIAIGSVLKSFTGGGATGGTAAAGQAPTAAQPQDFVTPTPDEVERDQRTAVTVNVQGNVLDRRETGLEIVSVLQEYFDTNDGVVARA